jgi:hypothetical protein
MSTRVVWYTGANLLSPSLEYVSAIEVMDYDMDGQGSIPGRRVRDVSFPNIVQGDMGPTQHTTKGITLNGTAELGFNLMALLDLS